MFALLKNLLRNTIIGVIEEDYEDIAVFELKVKRLFDNAKLPHKGSEYAAGHDLYAHSYAQIADGQVGETIQLDDDKLIIEPHSRCLIKTGISIRVPNGCYGRVAPRSGLALNKGIDIGAGVIDEDYRGEVGVIMFNHSSKHFEVRKDDRIAQLICERIVHPCIEEVDDLEGTDRGADGFGSTGMN